MSCKSDNIEKVLKKSKTPKLDLAYYTVIKTEMEELGNSILIVDRTIDTTSTRLKNLTPSFSKGKNTVYWKKEIFPRVNYINGDTLESYINGNPGKYWELRTKHKSGWLELTTPYFSKDKNDVVLEVKYFQGKSFGSSSYYHLKWTGKEYIVEKKELLSIS